MDLTKWAVIACDQYTSEPEYWRKAADLVGDAPSTLNIIYPEVYLNEQNPDARIARIRESMNRYLAQGLFDESEGFVYVERTVGGHIRARAWSPASTSSTTISAKARRASSGRPKGRSSSGSRRGSGSGKERRSKSPTSWFSIDDPARSVIGPLAAEKNEAREALRFRADAGLGPSRRLPGRAIRGLEKGVLSGLEASWPTRAAFVAKYGLQARHARPSLRHGRREPFLGHGQDHLGKSQRNRRGQNSLDPRLSATPWSSSSTSTTKPLFSSRSTASSSTSPPAATSVEEMTKALSRTVSHDPGHES